MVEDVVRAMGYTSLGTRFKRIGERLQAQSQEILEGFDAGVPSTHQIVLAALDRLGPSSIGEIAESVGIAQPGVTRMVSRLEEDGLVAAEQCTEDRRIRRVSLTPRGTTIVQTGHEGYWPRVHAAVADACASLEGSLIEQLDALEAALAEEPLGRRAARLEKGDPS